MSTPEQPATPPLTRKQLRELRDTGGTDIVTPEQLTAYTDALQHPGGQASVPSSVAPSAPPVAPIVPAQPVAPTPIPPVAAPLTRRQMREREQTGATEVTPDAPASSANIPSAGSAAGAVAQSTARPAVEPDLSQAGRSAELTDRERQDARAVINPHLGADLFEADRASARLPHSFDQLLTRPTSGSSTQANALIVPQASEGRLMAPVTESGDILITGSFNLPDRLGSTGHAPGTTDGNDVDAALMDGELPAHSSPSPIAASSAISTVRSSSGEVIAPPAPEKGSRLLLGLMITAGVLGIALASVIILAFVNGVLQ